MVYSKVKKRGFEMEKYRDYYVYELVDSKNNEVFYVGKGRGERGFPSSRGSIIK